jgi:hypothetical protein
MAVQQAEPPHCLNRHITIKSGEDAANDLAGTLGDLGQGGAAEAERLWHKVRPLAIPSLPALPGTVAGPHRAP